MPTRKIADIPVPCRHPEHQPPSHMVLGPGVYEHECPSCGKKSTFVVAGVTIRGDMRAPGMSDSGHDD
jgi:hypothetical protein